MEAGKEIKASGVRGCLLRLIDNTMVFRVYHGHDFVDYEITNCDCEVMITDPDAALISTDAGNFLDYTKESMGASKDNIE